MQGYDFYHLWKEHGVKVQMGGSDQWGNIVTGTELIRRKGSGQAFAITAPLITKADGSKFGKSEGGNVWLDKNRTSAYKFYQYWINAADEDAARYLRIFTLMSERRLKPLRRHAGNRHARHAKGPCGRCHAPHPRTGRPGHGHCCKCVVVWKRVRSGLAGFA